VQCEAALRDFDEWLARATALASRG